MKKKYIILTIIFGIITIISFFNIPIMVSFGVDVAKARGTFLFLSPLIVIIFAIPFACFLAKLISISKNKINKGKNIMKLKNSTKKIVLSGSAKFQNEYINLIEELKLKNFDIINFPDKLKGNILDEYPGLFKNFYKSIDQTEYFLTCNFDKNGIEGYIGAASFSELAYALVKNQNYNQNISIYLLNPPNKNQIHYDEIKLWLDLGWVKLWDNDLISFK